MIDTYLPPRNDALEGNSSEADYKQIVNEVLPLLGELAMDQISLQREVSLNENISNHTVATNEVLKSTIQATCNWVSLFVRL